MSSLLRNNGGGTPFGFSCTTHTKVYPPPIPPPLCAAIWFFGAVLAVVCYFLPRTLPKPTVVGMDLGTTYSGAAGPCP